MNSQIRLLPQGLREIIQAHRNQRDCHMGEYHHRPISYLSEALATERGGDQVDSYFPELSFEEPTPALRLMLELLSLPAFGPEALSSHCCFKGESVLREKRTQGSSCRDCASHTARGLCCSDTGRDRSLSVCFGCRWWPRCLTSTWRFIPGVELEGFLGCFGSMIGLQGADMLDA